MEKEAKGTLFAILSIPIFGLFPIVVKYGVVRINPIIFGSYAACISAAFLFIILFRRIVACRTFGFYLQVRFFIIGLFGTFLSSIVFFIGTTMTSGINASILLQMESVYSIFISRIFLSERITIKQMYATALVISGTAIVLYNGKLSINAGDILVLLTPLCWQISHLDSKKIMLKFGIDPAVIPFARTFYGGLLLFIFSLFLYPASEFGISSDMVWLVLFQGIVTYALGFVLWYKTLKLINLSKATALITPYPVFSFFMANLILGEKPTIYQIVGLIVVVFGIWKLSHIKSEIITNNGVKLS